ncbi:MAG: lipid-A-disaccharide synthase [Litoreibacter sp.]|nr:lipid-A-disaccharide synthase [Litoreibacter sp.]
MKIYLIAGEPSGDRLGAALMAGLKALNGDISFFGVGGPLMQAEGLDSLFPMDNLSVMGLAEVLPRLRSLLRLRDDAVADVLAQQPDVLITIDSPDFCLRVARKVKAAASAIKTVHYVAPTVWAWRPKRAAKMTKAIDHVLALFPFEPPYMEAAGMGCDFVGHPVVAEPVASEEEAEVFRVKHGLGENPIILILPGSRMGEVGRLAPIFGEALRSVVKSIPKARPVIVAAGPVAARVRELVKGWPGQPFVVDPRGRSSERAQTEKRAAFRAANLALAASGTVSLELAASGTPMVIAYDMNWLSRKMIKRMLRVDTVTLVNLVSETRAVPEFLGDDCKPTEIAEALVALVTDAEARQAQTEAGELTMERLGRGAEAPGLRAAEAVLRVIGVEPTGVEPER